MEIFRYKLSNGLRVIIHEDDSTPMAAINILYNVGSKFESPERTGFAHLFEHLMFGGSKNIPDYDIPIQYAGGENNAFTNTDTTNFYCVAPQENIETLLWLESDRMLQLKFSIKSLNTQKKVVIEEYKETCLSEPYGDVWNHLSPLAYDVHPYRWPVIGISPDHIKKATLDEVKKFFYKFYRPNNAIIAIVGNVKSSEVLPLVEKWFGDIPKGDDIFDDYEQEPIQTQQKRNTVKGNAPIDALYMAFKMVNRLHPDYYATDLLTDVLCNGHSSRLYRRLLKEKRLVSSIDAYISGFIDTGLVIIEARPAEGITLEAIESAIWEELELLKKELIDDRELQKLKNKIESTLIFSEMGLTSKAINLCFYEMLGDANWINDEGERYQAVTTHDILRLASTIFTENQSSILYYRA
ncbi:MAG: insulinase family protein [Saprospiraceae bacterium]|nr:insulinase family protein [Saprospiraceae bacterium]